MNNTPNPDWDPRSETVLRDQRAAYDEMRERCPVAYSDYLQWSVFRHEDVVRALNDPETFSNAASRHLSVPNGMDPPEHTEYRRIIEPYFEPERMEAFEPVCREIAADLTQSLLERDDVEFIANFAQPFAARVQRAFLGWPPGMRERLRRWTRKNQEATLAQDRTVMAEVAREFEAYVDEMLRDRCEAGAQASDDVTASLMHARVRGRPLRDEEIVSILRNWTVGEIGTISAAMGILVDFVANHADSQRQLRGQPSLLPNAIDEILRVHAPLVANRRVTTRPVTIAGREIGAGERVSLIWMSANRDGEAFEDPETVRLDRDPADNLLWGAGIHVCPGAPLARLEMQVAMEELLGKTTRIEPGPGKPPAKAMYPASGFTTLPLRIR